MRCQNFFAQVQMVVVGFSLGQWALAVQPLPALLVLQVPRALQGAMVVGPMRRAKDSLPATVIVYPH
jgi:hypothetical protein